MANEKWNCNQICRWNDPSDGCIKPTYATCPMANTEPDASGWGQVNEKRLIDANEVIRSMQRVIDEENNPNSLGCRVMREVIKGLELTPTVDAVEVVHGRWIEEPFVWIDRMEAINRICSVCGWKNVLKNNYCPNCGAKMDGERKDNG